ncbi:unnamed protein product [Blepharisma stoltei]|uniref:Uncharacterized protein n=1 Tax=Blepharisma stoltei TaxID=1481888 RepID=A0AAU9KIU3_9CILI|nr:unnamed protein product [Blepharisma stoltei]
MDIYENFEGEREERKIIRHTYHYAYLAASLVMITLIIIDLALHEWFTYCLWNFGLVYASSWTGRKLWDGASSISDVKDDACGSYKLYVESSCPGFCEHIDNFIGAGGTMLAFGIAAILFNLIAMGLVIWRMRHPSFRFEIATLFFIMPTLQYFLAFIIFYGVAEIPELEEVHKIGNINPHEYGMAGGMILAIVIIILQFSLMIYSLMVTRKAF